MGRSTAEAWNPELMYMLLKYLLEGYFPTIAGIYFVFLFFLSFFNSNLFLLYNSF